MAMKRRRLLIAGLFVLPQFAAPRVEAQGPMRPVVAIEVLRDRSTFAFLARIVALNASRVPQIPPTARTIVVDVARTFACPPAVGNFTNNQLTVLVADTVGLDLHHAFWFFAEGWVIGQQLAVKELARFRSPEADSAIFALYFGPQGPAAQIRQHIDTSAAVVIGHLRTDSLRVALANKTAGAKATGFLATRLVVTGRVAGLNVPDSIVVAVPAAALLEWTALGLPDEYQQLLFFVHSARDQIDGLVSNAPMKPSFMLFSPEDVRSAGDSASIAQIAQQNEPRRTFLPICAGLPK
jgi:hypothetical protein